MAFCHCSSRSVVSPLSSTDHNLLYEKLSSSASSWWVFLTPFPDGLKSPLACGTSPLEGPAHGSSGRELIGGEDRARSPSLLSFPQTMPVSSPSP